MALSLAFGVRRSVEELGATRILKLRGGDRGSSTEVKDVGSKERLRIRKARRRMEICFSNAREREREREEERERGSQFSRFASEKPKEEDEATHLSQRSSMTRRRTRYPTRRVEVASLGASSRRALISSSPRLDFCIYSYNVACNTNLP